MEGLVLSGNIYLVNLVERMHGHSLQHAREQSLEKHNAVIGTVRLASVTDRNGLLSLKISIVLSYKQQS